MKLLLTLLLFVAGLDVPQLQQRINSGKPDEALRALNEAVQADPKNPRLLYNRAVALYAAGKFEEALVDLDLVEDGHNKSLESKAQFQKGNAQFRLGLLSLGRDPEVTLSRWRQAVDEYIELLKKQPSHDDGRTNHDFVRRRLRELLLELARQNLQNAQLPRPADQRVKDARAAMDEFHEASQMEPQDSEAQKGEQQARDLLANSLAQEGERKTMTQNIVMPTVNEPPIARPDVAQIEEGVNMLQDAAGLKPNEQAFKDALERGKQRLADALTRQAQIYQSLEPRIPRIDEKLGLLRMAMELVEKALDQKPDYAPAQQTLEQIKQRLAQIHEGEGDRLDMASQTAPLDQQAQDLSQALDHFQQATELQPQQPQLPQKAQQTQARLEDALDKLGDKLMKSPGPESLEQQVTRMEGAAQAFNELESLKPTPQTSEKARAASEALEKLRQKLADQGQPMPQPGQGQQQQAMAPPQNQPEGAPMDSPPKLDTKGRNGRYQSGAMNRNLRDY